MREGVSRLSFVGTRSTSVPANLSSPIFVGAGDFEGAPA